MKVIDLVLFSIWQPIKDRIKLYLLREKVKKIFPESYIKPDNLFPIDKIGSIGKETYGFFKLMSFGESDTCKLRIGHYCSIGQEVTFILGGEHPLNKMSTYPFDKRILAKADSDRVQKGDIIIEDDVWIGYGATIMSGTKIGQGAVIGACSIIAKDIPPYAVCVGNGRIIKYRFPEDIRKKLLKLDYSKLTREMIINNQESLAEEITSKWFEENEVYNSIVRRRF